MEQDRLILRTVIFSLVGILAAIQLAMLIGPLVPHSAVGDKTIEALTHTYDQITGAFIAIMSQQMVKPRG